MRSISAGDRVASSRGSGAFYGVVQSSVIRFLVVLETACPECGYDETRLYPIATHPLSLTLYCDSCKREEPHVEMPVVAEWIELIPSGSVAPTSDP